MNYRKVLAFWMILFFFVTVTDALSIREVDIYPSNILYLDDVLSVNVSLRGNSCNWKIRFYVDKKNFTSDSLYHGRRIFNCGVEYCYSGEWDLSEDPIEPGTHALRVELIDPEARVDDQYMTIIRILDVKRTTTSTTSKTTTTTRKRTTTTTSTTTTTTSPKVYLEYENEEHGFRLLYLSTWEKEEYDSGAVVRFLTPLENIIDTFQEKVGISIQKVSLNTTLSEFTESSVDVLEETLYNFKLLDSSESDLAGQDAHQLVYEFSEYPYELKTLQVYTIKNGNVYIITYVAEVENYVKYLPDFRKIENTFQVTAVSTTTTSTTTSTTTTTTSTSTTTTTKPSYIQLISEWGIFVLIIVLAFVILFFIILLLWKRSRKEKPSEEIPEERRPEEETAEKPEKSEVSEEISREEVLGEVLGETPKEEWKKQEEERLERLKRLEEELDMAKPVETPVDKPVDKPVETPVDKPVDKPVETPVDKPVDKSVERLKKLEEELDMEKPGETPEERLKRLKRLEEELDEYSESE